MMIKLLSKKVRADCINYNESRAESDLGLHRHRTLFFRTVFRIRLSTEVSSLLQCSEDSCLVHGGSAEGCCLASCRTTAPRPSRSGRGIRTRSAARLPGRQAWYKVHIIKEPARHVSFDF